MADIEKRLILRDLFSGTFGKYIENIERSVSANEKLDQSAQNIENSWSNSGGILGATLEQMSLKLLKPVDDIEVLSNAFRDLSKNSEATASDIESAYKTYSQALSDMGYQWTELADEFSQRDLLELHSLDKLEQAGILMSKETLEAQALEAEMERINAENASLAEWAEKHEARWTAIKGKVEQVKNALLGFKSAQTPLDGIVKTVTRMALSFFTVRKLVGYFRNAVERAPDAIATKWNKLKSNINDLFTGAVVSGMDKMQAGIDRLNSAFASPAGQKFARGLDAIGSVIGTVVSGAFNKLADMIEWVGDNFETIMLAAAPVVGLLAIKMAALAVSTIAANLPLIGLISALGVFGMVLQSAGVTAADVFGGIGSLFGFLYGLIYNGIADIYNSIAVFAEFLANVFIDPVASVQKLFVSMVDGILGAIERLAGAIDKVFGTNLQSSVSAFRSTISDWADSNINQEKMITFDRMEHLDYGSLMDDFAEKARGFGQSISDKSLAAANAQNLKSIAKDTSSIKNAITEEDLKTMIDVAERAFISNVNLTSQTPVITINGANTGNTEADRRSLANALRDILIEQMAAGSISSSVAYGEG